MRGRESKCESTLTDRLPEKSFSSDFVVKRCFERFSDMVLMRLLETE